MWNGEIYAICSILFLLMDYMDIKRQSSESIGHLRTCYVLPKVKITPAWTSHLLVLKISGPNPRDSYFQDPP